MGYLFVKNLLDKGFALSGLVLLSPLLAGLSLAIKLEDGGAILFRQERVGKNGQPFLCFKFRTMAENSEALLLQWRDENHPHWQEYVASNFKLKNDPRVTRIGRLLRKTSLDELPQLLNILAGQMSLVGPRPLLAREIADYGEENYARYQQMRPGLTGLWQVSGRSNTTFHERARFDTVYFQRRSLWLDLNLIFKTFRVMLKKEGAY